MYNLDDEFMSIFTKFRRILGYEKFSDGSKLSNFTRESLVFEKDGLALEVPFIPESNDVYNVFLEIDRLYWFKKNDQNFRRVMSVSDRDLILGKVNEYCERRKYILRDLTPKNP
jgi:hypothetical protein